MKLLMVKDRNVVATKFLAQFANMISREGHHVEVACHTRHENNRGLLFDDNVALDNFYAKGNNWRQKLTAFLKQLLIWPPLLYKYKLYRTRPDVVVCYFLIDLFNVLLLGSCGAKVVMMVHNCPDAVFERIEKKSWLARIIYKKLLAKVDVIQVLQPSFVAPFEQRFKPKRVVCIANAIAQHNDSQLAQLHSASEDNSSGIVVYVGRVAKKGKRQHLLIEAFAQVAKNFPNWKLELWGLLKHVGYQRELETQIKELNLGEQVSICGYTGDIESVYRRADINAFPSLREGFGLGLADGMALGLPSLGFSYAPSVNELIEHGKNGYLADDNQQFADYLALLMSDAQARRKMGLAGRDRMREYTPERIMQQWIELLGELTVK